MHYRLYTPDSSLSSFIKCYWSLEGEELPGTQQRIFPDGCIELVFHYGNLFQKYYPDGTSNFQPRSFIHGQLTRFIEIGGNGRVGMFSVRFQPHGLRPFTNINTHELNDSNIQIADIWGAAGRELENRMLEASDNEQRVQIIEQFLLRQLQPTAVNALVNRGVDMINQVNGAVNIEELSAQLNIGRRHFERQFVAAVGLNPKQYARISRFQYVLSLTEQKRYNTLTDLAYSGGFYDQAHFIKDFREFSGLSPKQYFAEHLPLVKFFSFD
ncbi:MAG: AraC family transcriptional regulator [Chitinophagaceae bacterium]|nr:MAG: AraC family transcriptional regulator [Chitinophagaceae bacterium]